MTLSEKEEIRRAFYKVLEFKNISGEKVASLLEATVLNESSDEFVQLVLDMYECTCPYNLLVDYCLPPPVGFSKKQEGKTCKN